MPSPSHGATITVVVPIYNKRDLLRAALESITAAAERHGRVEIVLVDNGSTDGSYEIAGAFADRADVAQRRGSISHVRNWGARRGTGRYLSFLDCDMVVAPDFFVNLEALFASGVADAVGCECHLPDDPVWHERIWHELTVREDDGYRAYLNSGNFAMTRSLFERVGGFPEDFATGEDTEICRRIVALGERIYQSQTIASQHLGNPKTLREFFRRLRWHGLSITDGRRLHWHRSTIMMLTDVASLAAGLAVLVAPTRLSVGERLGVAAPLVLAVPTLTYAFRIRQVRRFVSPIPALFLTQLLFLARASAFAAVVHTLLRARRADMTGDAGSERARQDAC